MPALNIVIITPRGALGNCECANPTDKKSRRHSERLTQLPMHLFL
jgi:hypothetical protein